MPFWRYGTTMPIWQRILAVVIFSCFGGTLLSLIAACGYGVIALSLNVFGWRPAVSFSVILEIVFGVGVLAILFLFWAIPDIRPWLDPSEDPKTKKKVPAEPAPAPTSPASQPP